ncbi:serine--tRNA ligase [Paenibacillus athensensis]|uniref:Serine--tRNA ligase n=1 Tax=Paenibacillus athensensis TaxID=1967502 RepID=A0A4Y8Q381_9BACL|nr:serine--tRNA ligase [Paenibacillus athensensis]MCD1258665.1 serine--tRNA ligase [Paenibacillus athensensis]
MLDRKWIRQNQQQVQRVAEQKGMDFPVAQFIASDDERLRLLRETETLREERNRTSREAASLLRCGDQAGAERAKALVKRINEALSRTEAALRAAETLCDELLLRAPNIVSADTPIGASDADNVEIKRVGEPAQRDFPLKDHVELGELHGMIDIARGVKTAGSRQYYLKGAGVELHRAVQQLAVDLLVAKGFTLLEVPLTARRGAFVNTGYFPQGEAQSYRLADEERWLAGTAEVPLVSYLDNDIVDVYAPIKLAAASLCFRSEVGSTGRDVRGLYRVHQFAKVEQVIVCEADLAKSEQLFREITENAEDLLQLLELPYRLVAVCTGDMSPKTYKQIDIETWMPSRLAYGETHSSSHLLDFQARRSRIRYRDEAGELRFCHTLNNTAVASPRILIPLLEYHQQEDGSICIPRALQAYMNGRERLVPHP